MRSRPLPAQAGQVREKVTAPDGSAMVPLPPQTQQAASRAPVPAQTGQAMAGAAPIYSLPPHSAT